MHLIQWPIQRQRMRAVQSCQLCMTDINCQVGMQCGTKLQRVWTRVEQLQPQLQRVTPTNVHRDRKLAWVGPTSLKSPIAHQCHTRQTLARTRQRLPPSRTSKPVRVKRAMTPELRKHHGHSTPHRTTTGSNGTGTQVQAINATSATPVQQLTTPRMKERRFAPCVAQRDGLRLSRRIWHRVVTLCAPAGQRVAVTLRKCRG